MSVPLRQKEFKCLNIKFICVFAVCFLIIQTLFKVTYNNTFIPEISVFQQIAQRNAHVKLTTELTLNKIEYSNDTESGHSGNENKKLSNVRNITDHILNVINEVETSKSNKYSESVKKNLDETDYNNSIMEAGSELKSDYTKEGNTIKSDENMKPIDEAPFPPKSEKFERKDLDKFIKCNNKFKNFQPHITPNIGEEDEEKELKFIRRHPNLPFFIVRPKNLSRLIPPIYNIRWSGSLYQESWKVNPNCYLYSANFDSRLPSGPIVRILGICEIKFTTIDFFCQFWYNETENPVVSPVYEAGFPGRYVGNDVERKATMMSCKVPVGNNSKYPIAISIVNKQCITPTNIMKIGGSPSPKKPKLNKMTERNLTIGLCGKAIFFYNVDFSLRLIEWVEILRLLGVSKFFLYRTFSHENVEKVLDYYEKEGVAEVINFKHSNPYIEEGPLLRTWIYPHKSQFGSDERIYYNDCILRNKDNFDYLAIFDYDEIPILKKHKNLVDFLHYVNTLKGADKAGAFKLKRKVLHQNLEPHGEAKKVPEYLYILRHNVRNPSVGSNGKTIYDTNKILYVSCHSRIEHNAISPITNEFVVVNTSIAYTGHYRCIPCQNECLQGPFEEENRLLEYASEVESRMKIIREELMI